MLRIALTGAHGTGKTTLIGRLPELLEMTGRVGTCREAPRIIADQINQPEFFRRGNNTPLRQGLIFLQHLVEERDVSGGCDTLITDRTLIDHLAYTTVLFPEFVNSPEYSVYKSASIRSLIHYEHIFKLPIEFGPVDDGVRESDNQFQREIDQEIDRLYSAAGVAPTIIRGSVEERLHAIGTAILGEGTKEVS